jgi:5-methylcytosine-specific restriction enzyme subunit McrC
VSATSHRTISLLEHDSTSFAQDKMTQEEGAGLWSRYRDHVVVTFPSLVTSGNWRLEAGGWVGYLPVSEEFAVEIKPKVGVRNLFRMLEYAYRLESFRFLDDLFQADTLQDLYERLAGLLSRLVLDRTRRGLYRAYLTRSEHLPYVRGRLEARELSLRPWSVDLPCTYEDHAADIEDNRILSWTLFVIVRSGYLTGRELPNVRRAYRTLQGAVLTYPLGPESCVGRTYNRLNADYEPMHALCRFFLENSGPTHEVGDRSMLPFLVNMSRLYERFVAEWLKAHLPDVISLVPQERAYLDETSGLYFDIDLVLRDTSTGEILCVLDTKYKVATTPATDDVAQIVAYAEKMGCREAVLVYPRDLPRPFEAQVGDIRVRSLPFSLEGNVDEAGHYFMHTVLGYALV